MVDLIKEMFKEGDAIVLHTQQASYTGIIKSFSSNAILLLKEDGKIAGIKSDAIESFEAVDTSQDSVPPKDNSSLDNAKLLVLNEDPQAKTDVEESKQSEIKNVDQISSKTDDDKKVISPKVGLKIVGKIDLDKKDEERRKKKEAKRKYKESQNDKKIKIDSLEDLSNIILPETEKENKKFVPPIGRITKFFADRGFGFITDKFKNEIWFGFRSIIDDDLLQSLRGNQLRADIPVLFSLTKNYKGNAAVHIHKPKTVEEAIFLAEELFNEDSLPDTALGVVEQVLDAFPDNYSASKLKDRIEKNRFKSPKSLGKKKYRTYDLNYQEAKRAHNVEKNYPEALRLYKLALENNEKRESCIKDIAMLYVTMDERDKALEFMEQYEDELPDNITNYNFLENFYGSVREFRKLIEYIDLLLAERIILSDKRKYSFFLSKKGSAFVQLDELDEAKKYLEEAVSVYSENIYAIRLLDALDNPNKEELSQLIADAEFDTFGGGLSKYISDTLEYYDEYYGVPAKVIGAGDFTSETLNAIRGLINRAGRARPRERANYLLTEAKLMQMLEPEKDIRSVLAKHCNAMALNHISENSPLDIARYFYLEAFSLEENYDANARQVALYLMSFKAQFSELLSAGNVSIEQALDFVLSKEFRNNIWEGILSMFLLNRGISAQITSKLFHNEKYRTDAIKFLSSFEINAANLNKGLEEFSNAWNNAREKRQRDHNRWLASIKAIYSVDSLAVLASQLFAALNEAKKPWISQLDISRLNTIASDILDVLNQYLNQAGYKNKERNYNFAKAQINQLINEIKDRPTKFSYEGYIPLLVRIELLIDKDFRTVESASTPELSILIEGDSSVIEQGDLVTLQIRVENSPDASPVRELVLEIENNEDIEFMNQDMNRYLGSVDGGDSYIFKNLSLKVSDRVIHDKATTLTVKCSYKTRSAEEVLLAQNQLSLRLFSEEEFETIPNPYEILANSGPVTDTKMFYGRNEFIEIITDAILNAESKQVVIYGQKRSGKSSVLFHLKRKLEESKKTFCVSFSLGDIFESLSSATFFYKILSAIEEELENLEYNGQSIPVFEYPEFSEFRNEVNPADSFRRIVRNFKRTCQSFNGWKDKKLVILIDEFTYLYTAIKEGKVPDSIMKQWKAITQNQDATFSAVLVGQDVFPEFKREFPNEFGVTQDERLTYLSEFYARKLIEEPVWNYSLNKSRFIGKAVNTIIDYTSCNPYYIQIFCARLITEMNRKKTPAATEADIKDVAESFIIGGQALSDDKFDNLLNPGERHDIQKIPEKHAKAVLRQIANGARNIGFCPRENISIEEFTKEYEDEILDDLVHREVLERKSGDNYKIQVKLFQEWLLKN